MFDIENKPINAATLSDMSDSLFEPETVDIIIEVATALFRMRNN